MFTFDDITFRLAVCLRLGAPCVSPHCCHCGERVDGSGHHGLSCRRSAGRISRHASINDIICRALASAGVPAVLEPNGLVRDDGKRPDGMSLLPWKMGRPLVWDATCVDTLAPSHLLSTAACAGAAASAAEDLKGRKYSNLLGNYYFEPFGVETLGPWGPGAYSLYKEIAHKLLDSTRDQKAGYFFGQKISIAIQRGNAASLLGTFPSDSDANEYFDA
uniref:SFRICE_019335 n=1 Tax=Spodoptera frugiperda TaxID=7108 RepID=A0A2H1VRU3_SPOFR